MIHSTLDLIHATPSEKNQSSTQAVSSIATALEQQGHCLLRGFESNLSSFSELTHALCSSVTFDPARQHSGSSAQKVDAGTDAIGLHVENGNTPRIPQLVAFYCAQAARTGSQTTVCDGAQLLDALDASTKKKLKQPLNVTRTLSEPLWKAYLANEHPAQIGASHVREEHLWQMIKAIPGQSAHLNSDGSLEYTVTVAPILRSHKSNREAFANAILGPSFNYQPPVYTFADGSTVDEEFKASMAILAEQFTHEIQWQDGDIAIIDNHRVMHGRRAITDATRRQLYIAMGNF